MKALALFSGGLDSTLAIKLIQDQRIEVIALNFTSPFCTCIGKGCSIINLANNLGVKIKTIHKGLDYLRIIKNPKHGYGKNLNPCIDCRIYILKKAKKQTRIKIGPEFPLERLIAFGIKSVIATTRNIPTDKLTR